MESESEYPFNESESQILSSQKVEAKLSQHGNFKQNIFNMESFIDTFITESEIYLLYQMKVKYFDHGR